MAPSPRWGSRSHPKPGSCFEPHLPGWTSVPGDTRTQGLSQLCPGLSSGWGKGQWTHRSLRMSDRLALKKIGLFLSKMQQFIMTLFITISPTKVTTNTNWTRFILLETFKGQSHGDWRTQIVKDHLHNIFGMGLLDCLAVLKNPKRKNGWTISRCQPKKKNQSRFFKKTFKTVKVRA